MLGCSDVRGGEPREGECMADTLKDAMREFRFLDDKRKERPLSPEEESRWKSLRTLVGGGASQVVAASQPAQAAMPGYPMENPNAFSIS